MVIKHIAVIKNKPGYNDISGTAVFDVLHAFFLCFVALY